MVSTIVALPHGGARRLTLTDGGTSIVLEAPGAADAATRKALVAAARRILALDVDVSEFHDTRGGATRVTVDRRQGRGPVPAQSVGVGGRREAGADDELLVGLHEKDDHGSGRALRRDRVRRHEVVPDARTPCRGEREGIPRPGSRRLPLALSRFSQPRRRSGESNPAAWDHDPAKRRSYGKRWSSFPGVGPYVAENLLKFIGKPDGLAIDSAIRAKYSEVYHGGRKIKDTTIARRLAPLGRWAALALWFDLWRAWSEGDEHDTWV
jgi:hypothetical protein